MLSCKLRFSSSYCFICFVQCLCCGLGNIVRGSKALEVCMSVRVCVCVCICCHSSVFSIILSSVLSLSAAKSGFLCVYLFSVFFRYISVIPNNCFITPFSQYLNTVKASYFTKCHSYCSSDLIYFNLLSPNKKKLQFLNKIHQIKDEVFQFSRQTAIHTNAIKSVFP